MQVPSGLALLFSPRGPGQVAACLSEPLFPLVQGDRQFCRLQQGCFGDLGDYACKARQADGSPKYNAQPAVGPQKTGLLFMLHRPTMSLLFYNCFSVQCLWR